MNSQLFRNGISNLIKLNGQFYKRSTIESNKVLAGNTSTASTIGLKDLFEHKYQKGAYPLAGRSWAASDLRGKSFNDLHEIWFELLRERNKILSEKASNKNNTLENPLRLRKVKKSMAAVKTVLGERDTLKKSLYLLREESSSANPSKKRIQELKDKVEKLNKLVGAISLTPGLKELESLQSTLKVDENLEKNIDSLIENKQ